MISIFHCSIDFVFLVSYVQILRYIIAQLADIMR